MSDSQVVYELAVIYHPKTGEEHEASVQVAKGIIEKANGKIEKEDVWDAQQLAYPIGKETSGIYAFYQLTFSSLDKLKQLGVELNMSSHVLRHLLTKLDQKRIAKAQALADKLAEQRQLTDEEANKTDKTTFRLKEEETEDSKDSKEKAAGGETEDQKAVQDEPETKESDKKEGDKTEEK